MALTERLALQITADGAQAVRGINDVGRAADRQLGAAEGRFKQAGVAFASMGTRIAAAGVGVGATMFMLANEGAELSQNIATTGRVFGEASGEIAKFGTTAADSLGMSESAFRLNANRLGSMLTNLGFAQGEAAKISVEMSTIATDLGAAFGTDTTQAIEAIGAAFRGERDPIEQFGISLKQADIDAKVAALGLDTSTASAKKHSDAVASMALIQEQASKTAGSFADSIENGGGAAKVAAAKFDDAKKRLGQGLTPALAAAAEGASGLVESLTDFFTLSGDKAKGLGDLIRNNEAWGQSSEDAARYQQRVNAELAKTKAEIADMIGLGALLKGGALGFLLNSDAITSQQRLAAEMHNASAEMSMRQAAARKYAEAMGISYEAAWALLNAEKKGAEATKEGTEATEDQAKEVKTLAERWDDARRAVEDWMDTQTDGLNAEADYYESSQDLSKQLREKGTGFNWLTEQVDLLTEAGRENLRQSREWADDAVNFAAAQATQTGSLETGRAALQAMRDWFIKTQTQAGMTEAAAKAYADQIGLLPEKVTTIYEANGLSQQVIDAQRLLDKLKEAAEWRPQFDGLVGGLFWGGGGSRSEAAPSGARTAGGQSGTRSVVNVTVHGSVIAERDLADTVAKSLATREMALR